MPRRKMVCAGGCGKLVEPGTGSGEKVTCRDCRGERRRLPSALVCEQCEEVFERYVAPDAVKIPRFCSRKCYKDALPHGGRKASARARKLGRKTWDGVTDEQIWDRDDWACLIPGCTLGPLRADLKYPHPLSPSIDHIVPKSRAADDFPWDVQENKRGAHYFCNTSRSNRMTAEETRAGQAIMALVPMPVRLPKPKVVHFCVACQDVPVGREGATCQACYKSARAVVRDAMQEQALTLREGGMSWKKIAADLGLSGPGAARNVAYPPWDRYAGGKDAGAPSVKQQPPVKRAPVADDTEASLWWTTVRP
jgi:hypothetical protein